MDISTDDLMYQYILIEGTILDEKTFVFCAESYENREKKINTGFVIFFENDQWKLKYELQMQPVSIACGNDKDVYVLGRQGECFRLGANEGPLHIEYSDALAGPFRKIREIGGAIHVLGCEYSVWRLNNSDWIKLNEKSVDNYINDIDNSEDIDIDSIIDEAITDTEIMFAIAGRHRDDMVLVGVDGKILYSNGADWQLGDTPTNVLLSDVCYSDDGFYYACGSNGTVIKGRDDSWSALDLENISEDFCSIVKYGDKIFIASGEALYCAEGDKITEVDFGTHEKVPSHFVTAKFGKIMSIAAKEVIVSDDGAQWRSLIF